MDARNLLTITNSNLRLNMKQTLFPAILLLFVIPLIYGTSNLDSMKSADCLERMAALIGLPMFVPLLKPEQNGGMDVIITMRPFPYRRIVVLRVMLSLTCTVALKLDGESNSIINQKKILEKYCRDHGYTAIRHYDEDDGYSGTNFAGVR